MIQRLLNINLRVKEVTEMPISTASVSQRLFRQCIYLHDTRYLLLAMKPDSDEEKGKDFMACSSQMLSDP